MFGQTQCPVCTLYLHAGMKLEQHLETHPKEQVIKALVAATSVSANEAPQRPPQIQNNGVIYGEPNVSLIHPSQINYIPQTNHQPPRNFVLLNRTSTKIFQRHQNAAYILNNNPPQPNYLPIMEYNDKPFIKRPAICNNLNNVQQLITNDEILPQKLVPSNEIDIPYSDYYENQDENIDENEYEYNNENENDLICAEENFDDDIIEKNGQIAAQYYERDNGDFLVSESPKLKVEYTEGDDGDFLVTKKVIRPSLNLIHFVEDPDANVLNTDDHVTDDKNDIELYEDKNHNENNCNNIVESIHDIPLVINNNSNNNNNNIIHNPKPSGLKVLSNVKLTPDMLSSGIKDIIISAQSANLTETNTSNVEIPSKKDIRTYSRVIRDQIKSATDSLSTAQENNDLSATSRSVIRTPLDLMVDHNKFSTGTPINSSVSSVIRLASHDLPISKDNKNNLYKSNISYKNQPINTLNSTDIEVNHNDYISHVQTRTEFQTRTDHLISDVPTATTTVSSKNIQKTASVPYESNEENRELVSMDFLKEESLANNVTEQSFKLERSSNVYNDYEKRLEQNQSENNHFWSTESANITSTVNKYIPINTDNAETPMSEIYAGANEETPIEIEKVEDNPIQEFNKYSITTNDLQHTTTNVYKKETNETVNELNVKNEPLPIPEGHERVSNLIPPSFSRKPYTSNLFYKPPKKLFVKFKTPIETETIQISDDEHDFEILKSETSSKVVSPEQIDCLSSIASTSRSSINNSKTDIPEQMDTNHQFSTSSNEQDTPSCSSTIQLNLDNKKTDVIENCSISTPTSSKKIIQNSKLRNKQIKLSKIKTGRERTRQLAEPRVKYRKRKYRRILNNDADFNKPGHSKFFKSKIITSKSIGQETAVRKNDSVPETEKIELDFQCISNSASDFDCSVKSEIKIESNILNKEDIIGICKLEREYAEDDNSEFSPFSIETSSIAFSPNDLTKKEENIDSEFNLIMKCEEERNYNVAIIDPITKSADNYSITELNQCQETITTTVQHISTQFENDQDIKLPSWTDEIKVAIETIESHSDELPPYHSTLTSSHSSTIISNSKQNSSEVSEWNVINSQEQDTNLPGPSHGDYRLTNFFAGNYEHNDYGYNNTDKNNKFLEFIEDGQTATWKHPFSPQYVNFETDRTSYTDLDAYKGGLSYNRAASTESLNIRTDEKMPARGEISEQESNGEVDVSWNNHQVYSNYQPDFFPKYPNQSELHISKDAWKTTNDNGMSFAQNLPKFPSIILNTTEEIDKKPEITEIKDNIEIKKARKPRIFRCSECVVVFHAIKLRRAHMHAEHPEACNTKKTAKNSNLSLSDKTQLKLSFSSIKISGDVICNSFEIKNPAENNAETDEKPLLMGFFETKTEELKTSTSTNLEQVNIFKGIKTKKKKAYKCDKCSEEFKSIKLYNSHLSIHPAACKQCGKTFRHFTNLTLHLKRHLGIKNHVCHVKLCGKRFVLKQSLEEHMRIHTNAAPIVCNDCPQKFRRYSNLVQHRNRHHLNIKPEQQDYVCHCGEVFHSKAKFSWHKEIHDAKPKGCPYCRERFIHKNSLTRHIRLSHVDKYWYFQNQAVECPICNQLYLKTSIKHHINKHNIKSENKCNICNKVFSTKWNLKQHRWIHACRSTKPYKCKTCTAAFVRESDYTTHMNVHKSIKPFTCDFCGCQFSRKYNWLRHTREHESPKKFKCNICNKSFHRAFYLTEHSRIHSGERPYSCNICGKTSATKTNHNKHIVIHHARDPLTAEG